MENHELILRLKQSDKAAFNELFHQYYKRLCRFAFVILKCEQSAEEIVQDTFVRLWEKRNNLDQAHTNIDSYLFVAVKNASLNLIRHNKIKQDYCTENDSLADAGEPDHFDKDAFLQKLGKAIEKLPEQCRMIYYLKNFEGLTHDEIAAYMELNPKTVENQVHIALIKLREMLYQYKDSFYRETL